ncbi:MAG: hypothetical protein N2444_09725, partial [Methylocystis sp.]|nr:hypothetical protein [Methylocystis sp.]
MSARSERLSRVAALTEKLWRLELARRAKMEQALAEVTGARDGALGSLADLRAPPLLPIARLKRCAIRQAELVEALERQSARALAQGQRARLGEKPVSYTHL